MILELGLLGFFLLCWLLSILIALGDFGLSDLLPFGLYSLYALAAFGGWLSGNFFVYRSARLPAELRRRLLLIYLLGPPGVLYLLQAMGPEAIQRTVPLAPVYGFGVYAVLFLVPVSLRRSR